MRISGVPEPSSRAGGPSSRALRPLGAIAALAVAVSATVVWTGGDTGSGRPAFAVPNGNASPAVVSVVGSARHVMSAEAPERLVPDTVFPTEPVRLLWFEGRPAQPLRGAAVVTPDGAGGVLEFDDRLHARRPPLETSGREIVAAAAGPGDGLWLADVGGEVFRVDRAGRRQGSGPGASAPVHAAQLQFEYVDLGGDSLGDRVWIVRSPDRFPYRWYGDETPPLLAAVDSGGARVRTIGRAVIPAHVLLADLANAGRIAVAGDTVYYAPFIRDQVLALTALGDTLWIASRGLPHSRAEPRFELTDGKPVIDYAPVNLGIALGLDGRLYVLSTPGFTTEASRLDVFDRTNGALLRSARIPTALPTLAVDASGRVYSLDAFRLLTGVPPRQREPFHSFALETLDGGTLSLGDLQGKVTLVNFWASWCAPCRTEMPALDSLRRGISDPAFALITINEDANPDDARAFIAALGSEFPVLLGRGRMKGRYHYLGLPFTVLLDRDGRVVQRWLGFAGAEQVATIRTLIRAELERGPAAPGDHNHTGHASSHGATQHR